MPPPPKPHRAALFEAMPWGGQLGLLLAGSLLLAALFALVHLPAALLLGPMIAGIILGSNGARLSLPRRAVFASQTIVGCLIARSITGDIVHAFLRDWPLLLATVLTPNYTDTLGGKNASATYSVVAYDAAGNTSTPAVATYAAAAAPAG